MSLSKKTKEILTVAMADKKSAAELAAAVDSMHAVAPAANVAALGTTTGLPAAALSTADTYTDAAVNTAINALKTASETRLDNIETKVDAIIAALIAAGLMS
jgi:predicted RNA methylase